jgi:hypothetical protein
MAHHKRKGPKSTRAGCLLCKPYKRQGHKRTERARFNQYKKAKVAAEKVADAISYPHTASLCNLTSGNLIGACA